ncbi:MAG: ribosome silencing factor [Parachlamydiales bacterium]|nr:ribosome silencing factor [Parachlamydiales bacterium]
MKNDAFLFVNNIAQAIFDKKGFNIFALDIHNLSSLTNYVLIAEGNVSRHVHAIAQEIIEKGKKIGISPCHVEGMEEGDWIVIDYGDVIVHLFIPSLRQKYQLEKLWQEGNIMTLNIDEGAI